MQRPSTRLWSLPYSSTDAGRGSAHPQRDGVGLPVGDGRRATGQQQREDHEVGPATDEHVQGGPHGQQEADEDEHQDVGAALVLSDLVVHAGVRVLGGSET